MKTTYRIFLSACTAFCMTATGCSDLKEITDRVDDLDNRVTILESKTASLNSNIEALQILSGETFIQSVSKEGDTYTITLSNNETLTISQGSTTATPVLSINEEGFWTVDYQDGEGPQLLGGKQIPATGDDGVTPLFGVDENNFWTVSYDGGESYRQVLDESGNPVSAIPESGTAGDSFFSNVEIDETAGLFILTLHEGRTIELAIVPDFLCGIEDGEGVQVFDAGQTRTWTMKFIGITEENCIVTAPQGWTASIDGTTLTVSAPETQEAETKAVIADTRTDVSVLAFKDNYSTVAKLKVQIGAGTGVIPAATVSANVSEDIDKVSFNVSLTDATSYRYLLKGLTDEAPSKESVVSEGTESTELLLIISGCVEYTQYILYLVPMYGDIAGEVVTCTARSGERDWTSLFEKYQAGFDIVIGERIYNRTEWGEGRLISTDTEFKGASGDDPRVLFIKPGVTLTYASSGAANRLAFIGDSPDDRSARVILTQYIRAKADAGTDGHLVFYNLTFDSSEWTNYVFTNNTAGATYPYIAWVDCDMKTLGEKNFSYIGGSSNSGYGEVRIQGCDWHLSVSSAGTEAILIHPNKQAFDFDRIVFINNIFYADEPTVVRIFTGEKSTLQQIIFTNNTFYNIGGNTNFWIRSKSLGEMTVKDNLFQYGGETDNNWGFYKSGNLTQTNGNIYDGHTGITGEVRHNAYWFANASDCDWQIFFWGTSRADISSFTYFEEPAELSEDPFTEGTADIPSGTFIPAARYSGYGAVR